MTYQLIYSHVPLGEHAGNRKLTAEQVLKIRASTEQIKAIAYEFNISRQTVLRIRKRELWSHI